MPDPSTLPPLGVLVLIGRSFRLLGAHFTFLFPLAFVPALALAILTLLLGGAPDGTTPTAAGPVASTGEAVALLLGVLLSFVISGVMSLAALDALLGKRHAVREYLTQTMRHIGPIVVLGLLLSVATGLGMVIFVLPGLYILGRYLPWILAVVFENAGWSGLGRAQELTAGYRWPLAAAATLVGSGLLAIVLLLTPLVTAASGSALFAVLAEGLFSGVYYALISIFTALAYLRLREIKEGVTAAEIAASFD